MTIRNNPPQHDPASGMDREDQDLLIRLDERTKKIEEKLDEFMKRAGNGGWTRCADRGIRLKLVEDSQKTHRSRHMWYSNLIIALGAAELLALVFAPWKG
ncbi:MAG: hypothetical protein WA151_11350 [Desulfatirhabdiaceae bacterium]